MAGTYLLRNWSVSVHADSNPYKAPDSYLPGLAGSRREVGAGIETEVDIVTSSIVKVDGKKITTYSGSVYLLEEVSPDYLDWMQKNGINFDPENPIKFKKALDSSLN